MRHSKSSLFLMELIIALLFFSLASTVCIRLFAKSHLLSRQTVNQNHAVIQAQNLAEGFLSTEGDLTALAGLFQTDATGDCITLYFDKNWNSCSAPSAAYSATLQCSCVRDGSLIQGNIQVTSLTEDNALSAEPLYALEVVHHIAQRRGDL